MDQEFLKQQLDTYSRVHQVVPIETGLIKGVAWTTGPILGGGRFEFLIKQNRNHATLNADDGFGFLFAGKVRLLASADGTLGTAEITHATRLISKASSDWLDGTYENHENNAVVFDTCLRNKLTTLGIFDSSHTNKSPSARIYVESANHFLDQLKLAGRMRGIAIPESTIASLSERFPTLERQRFGRAGLNEIVAEIPIDLVDALRSTSTITGDIWQYYTKNTETGVRRRQAAKSFPLLASRLAENHRISIQKAIENGEPLAPVIQDRLGLSKPIVKRLPKLVWDTHPIGTEEALKALNACPPDWTPKTEQDWRSFCEVVSFANYIQRLTGISFFALVKNSRGKWGEVVSKAVQQLPSVAAGPNDNEMTSTARAAAQERLLHNAEARAQAFGQIFHILDTQIGRLHSSLVLPVIAHQAKIGFQDLIESSTIEESKTIAGHMLFEGKSIPDIVESARRWSYRETLILEALDLNRIEAAEAERRTNEMLDQIADLRGRQHEHDRYEALQAGLNAIDAKALDLKWPCFFGGRKFIASNGYEIICMTSSRELMEESDGSAIARGLGHCVGQYNEQVAPRIAGRSYNTSALLGKIALLSIRKPNADGTFKRKATLEVALESIDGSLHRYADFRDYHFGNMHPDEDRYPIVQFQGKSRGVSANTSQALDELKRAVKLGQFIPSYMNNHTEAVSAWEALGQERIDIASQSRAASEEIRKMISELEGQVYHANHTPREYDRGLVGRICGYDWSCDDNIVRIWKVWADPYQSENGDTAPALLSSKWRNMGLERFANSDPVMNSAAHLNPYIRKEQNRTVAPIVAEAPDANLSM